MLQMAILGTSGIILDGTAPQTNLFFCVWAIGSSWLRMKAHKHKQQLSQAKASLASGVADSSFQDKTGQRRFKIADVKCRRFLANAVSFLLTKWNLDSIRIEIV